ncbi:MAG: hypothetical protein JSV36_16670, partial [Anaerolineae bacterium]
AAERALKRLVAMFRDEDTRQSVRWPVVDALSLLDPALVTERVVDPILQDGVSLGRPDKMNKSLAYLIGLLRLRKARAHDFLVEDCLGLDGDRPLPDWSTWSTAIVALGRIADQSDQGLLAEIAAGRRREVDLGQLFPDETHRTYVRRAAIDALANTGELDTLAAQDRERLATVAPDPALSPAYYRAVREIYWRGRSRARSGR